MPKRTIAANGPDPIDVHVGRQIRIRRTLRGVSQEKLAEHLGLTFQQVQKYENGRNRCSPSKLFRIAELLETPVADFYPDSETPSDPGDDPTLRRESLELMRHYWTLPEEGRAAVYYLVKAFAAE